MNKDKENFMKCPKCGFQQPEDPFCASCGINISKYQKRKRKYVIVGILSLGIVLAAVIILYQLRSPEKAPEHEAKVTETLPQNPPPHEISPVKQPGQERMLRAPRKTTPVVPPPEPVEVKEDKEPEKVSPKETPPKTALDWFNEGVSLSNDSPEEINCYEQALKLEPNLAVAHYNLGVIYYSQGNETLAKSHFRSFLRYATDTEASELPVENYYPLEKLSETSEVKEKEGVTEEKVGEVETKEEVKNEEVEVEKGGEAEEKGTGAGEDTPGEAETEEVKE